MKIVLMGYMGSGKSTVGSALAEKLNTRFVDLDVIIENSEGQNITEIFQQSGAIYFRKLESRILKEILNEEEDLVLSLGGGTPCYGNNLEIISTTDNCTSIYLSGSVLYLAERLYLERRSRPLIASLDTKDDLLEFVGKHIFERSEYYLKADYKIEVDKKSVDDIVSEIRLLL